jgi:tetratricopeptide (TPR) repeat protein
MHHALISGLTKNGDINEGSHDELSCTVCLTEITTVKSPSTTNLSDVGSVACETCRFSVCAECCTKKISQQSQEQEDAIQDKAVIIDSDDDDDDGSVIILEDPQTMCQQATELLQQLSSSRRDEVQESLDAQDSPESTPTSNSSAYHQAMELYQQAFQIRYTVLGPNHITLAGLHCLIARALASQRHYTTAMENYTRAMRIYSSSNDSIKDKDNTVRDDTNNITQQLQKEMAYTLDTMVEAANAAMMQGFEFQANNHNQIEPALYQFEHAHSLLASVLQNTPADLIVIDEEDVEKASVSEETKHHTLAFVDVCRVLASVHVSLRDYGQALPYLQQAYCVLVPLLGMEDPRTRAMASDKATVQALAIKQNKSNNLSFVSGDNNVIDNIAEVMHWFERDDYSSNNDINNNSIDTEEDGNDNFATSTSEHSTNNDHPTANTTFLGISVNWIKRGFWEELQASNLTTNDTMLTVLEKVIRPKCVTQTVSSYRASLPTKHTGPASLLISYVDESTVADVINSLDDFCRTHGHKDESVHVWMHGLCEPLADDENRSSNAVNNDQRSKALHQRISSIGHVLAIMTPWTHPLIWNQAACLSEIYAAHQIRGCKLTLVLPPAQTAAVFDALVGDLYAPIATLYKALDDLRVESSDPSLAIKPHQITQGLQGIFHSWIRNVLKAQVQEHCIFNADAVNSAATAVMVADENNPPTRRPSITLADGKEIALEVFQLQLCNKMGLLFWNYGEYKAALELLEDALGMTERMYGEEHESTATFYQNIANVCFDMGRYEVARQTYHQVLILMEALLPEHHPRIGGMCTKLGHLYRIIDDFDKAMEYHQRALTVHVKHHHGSSHNLASADSYNDIGNVLYSTGNNDAALIEFRKALGIQQSILGTGKHQTLALTHAQIGMVMKAKGNLEDALKEYQTAAMIQEASIGTDHVQTAPTYENLTSVFRCQDNLDAALEVCRKSKDCYDKALGAYHPTTATAWQTLGAIQNDMDMVEDALQSYQTALEIRESLGDVQQTAETLQSIGTLLFEVGDPDEALVTLRKAFDILEPILGIDHPSTTGLADMINNVLEA